MDTIRERLEKYGCEETCIQTVLDEVKTMWDEEVILRPIPGYKRMRRCRKLMVLISAHVPAMALELHAPAGLLTESQVEHCARLCPEEALRNAAHILYDYELHKLLDSCAAKLPIIAALNAPQFVSPIRRQILRTSFPITAVEGRWWKMIESHGVDAAQRLYRKERSPCWSFLNGVTGAVGNLVGGTGARRESGS